MTQYLAPVTERFEEVVQVELGAAVPRRGNRSSRAVAVGIMAMFGWRVKGELPNLPKFLMIGVPHTSNWDMFWGMVGMYALGLRIAWMAKHVLFYPPYGWLFRWLGGVSVNRNASQGLVQQMVDAYHDRQKLILVVLPEGTRRRTSRWKTGFYHIAVGAELPVVPVCFDYERKVLELGPVFHLSGDVEADLPQLQAHFRGVRGRYPKNYGL